MIDTNLVFISGKLGRDAKNGFSKGGTQWANCSVAITKKTGKDQYGAVWANVVAFGRTAEILSTFKKGDAILVKGEINSSSREVEGKKVYETGIIARLVYRGESADSGEEEGIL